MGKLFSSHYVIDCELFILYFQEFIDYHCERGC
jgi:hypothetical protein